MVGPLVVLSLAADMCTFLTTFRRSTRQKVWASVYGRLDSVRAEDLKILRRLEGHPLTDDEVRGVIRRELERRDGARDRHAQYAAHLADKFLTAVRSAVQELFLSDPLAHLHPWSRALSQVEEQLRTQGSDLRELVAASREFMRIVTGSLGQLPPGALPWRPLEKTLRQDEDDAFEPKGLRLAGPTWWDFREGRVLRREHVDVVLQHLRGNPTGSISVISGESAAGKTVMAEHVGFEWRQNAPVFWINAGAAGAREAGGPALVHGIGQLAKRCVGDSDALPLFIVDDLHRDWEGRRSSALVESLTGMQRPPAHVLLVARPFFPRVEEDGDWPPADPVALLDPGQDLVIRLGTQDFEQAAPRIAQLHWQQKTGEALAEPPAQELAAKAGNSLRLLVWMVEGYTATRVVDRRLAYAQIRKHLAAFHGCGFTTDHRVGAVVLAVAAFSRLHAPIDGLFVKQQLAKATEVEETLERLCELGELHDAGPDSRHGHRTWEYSLPHPALADMYIEATERAGTNWLPARWLREMLECEDWSTELIVRRLKERDRGLFVKVVGEAVVRPERVEDVFAHPAARKALLDVAKELICDTKARDRWCAVRCLGWSGGRRAVEVLIGLVRAEDETEEVRRCAAQELTRSPEGAVRPLIEALDDEKWRVRDLAALALGEIGDSQAVGRLIGALTDEHEHVQWGAARALGKIGHPHALEPLKGSLRSEDKDLASTAAHALGEIGDVRAVGALLEALKNPDADEHVRAAAAYALGGIGDLRAVSCLTKALEAAQRSVRWSVAVALGRLKDPSCVEPLMMKGLRDEDDGVRQVAASALGEIADGRAVPALIEGLRDPSPVAAGAVAEALGKMKAREALDDLIKALTDDRDNVRQWAAWALGELADCKAVDALVRRLQEGTFLVPAYAADALGKIGNARAVGPLVRALRSGDVVACASAALALGKMRAEQAIEPLVGVFAHEGRHMRLAVAGGEGSLGEAAIAALVSIGAPAVAALRNSLDDEDWVVRRFAVLALGEIAGADAIDALKHAARDRNAKVRNAAESALTRTGKGPAG